MEKSLQDLQADQTNYKLHIELGDSYILMEDLRQAEAHYLSAIELLRKHPEPELIRKQLIMLYGKLLSIAPENQDAYIKLAEEYIAAGEKEKATRFLLSSAKKAYESEQYELALNCYNFALEMGKTNPHILERCSEIYLKLGKQEEAVENYMQLGDMFAKEEKYIEALNYYKHAGSLQKDEPDLMLKIARMYHIMGWVENAASELVKLGKHYENIQNYPEALKYYQNSQRLDPENPHAREGKERMSALNNLDIPWEVSQTQSAPVEEADILAELEKVEHRVDRKQSQDEAFDKLLSEIDVRIDSSEPAEEQAETSAQAVSVEDWIIDLDAEELTIASGLNDDADDEETVTLNYAPQNGQTPESAHTKIEFIPDVELEESADADEKALSAEHETPAAAANAAQQQTAAAELSVETLPKQELAESVMEQPHDLVPLQSERTGDADTLTLEIEEEDARKPETAFTEQFDLTSNKENDPEITQKIKALEKQLQNTEEEKYFLQEQFTAQISQLKARETSLQQEFEHSDSEKMALEKRLQQIMTTYQAHRHGSDNFDQARYEALIAKIQNKKTLLQQHLSLLIKKREENGRFLTQELNTLAMTKQRLQSNLKHIQQVKTHIEGKFQTELRQAKQKIHTLTDTADTLEGKLHAQQQGEQELRKQFEALRREKDALQDEYTETITAVTAENEQIEQQLQEFRTTKSAAEEAMKENVRVIEQSYQQLKAEYKTTLATKEQELNDTAKKLGAFADEYVKLEKTMSDIRKERDKLDKLLARETATREMLEEKLIGIETQVDSLEVQGSKLLEQLGQELDRQFSVEVSATDKFHGSLEEFERLLQMQEQEIHSLETIRA